MVDPVLAKCTLCNNDTHKLIDGPIYGVSINMVITCSNYKNDEVKLSQSTKTHCTNFIPSKPTMNTYHQ